jgi:hypothetical protein
MRKLPISLALHDELDVVSAGRLARTRRPWAPRQGMRAKPDKTQTLPNIRLNIRLNRAFD